MPKSNSIWFRLKQWFDTDQDTTEFDPNDRSLDWVRCFPYFAMHLACLAVIWVGWSPVAVWTALGFYLIRMFAITGFYHRYFSHRSFKTNRFFQFLFALLGCTAVQRGPLWWAAHHRHHHRVSDQPGDLHSPVVDGFWWSHLMWFTSPANFKTHYDKIKDFSKFPELVFLTRYDLVIPFLFALAIFAGGWALEIFAPGLGTNRWQMLVWGFFISTIVLGHATFTINSLSHIFGKKHYQTKDNSRNNWFLAMITLGEGWHNNHHRFPGSVRQGFVWWEIDLTYYALRFLALFGIVWDLRPVPQRIIEERRNPSYSQSHENPEGRSL